MTSLYDDIKNQVATRINGTIEAPLADLYIHELFVHHPKNEAIHSTGHKRLKHTHPLIKKYLKSGDTLIDIGISTGETTLDLKKEFKDCNIVGTEIAGPIARTASEELRGTGIEISTYNFAENKKPPFSNVKCVRCVNAMMYMRNEERENTLRNILEILVEGGVFLLGIHLIFASFVKDKNKFKLKNIHQLKKKIA